MQPSGISFTDISGRDGTDKSVACFDYKIKSKPKQIVEFCPGGNR